MKMNINYDDFDTIISDAVIDLPDVYEHVKVEKFTTTLSDGTAVTRLRVSHIYDNGTDTPTVISHEMNKGDLMDYVKFFNKIMGQIDN